MRRPSFNRLLAAMAAGLALNAPARAEDIDLFAGADPAGSAGNPNVLFVIDNTSNWSRNDQKWPGEKQGQSELQALKQVVGTLDANVNAGLMMFNDSNAGGGYVRYAVRPMTDANKLAFQNKLQHIYDNFSSPAEKVSSSKDYSSILFDVFKYFGGYTSPPKAQSNIPGSPLGPTAFGPQVYAAPATTLADPAAYADGARTVYSPPGTVTADCARNYIIFVGNGFPNADDKNPAMHTILAGVEGDTAQVPGVLPSNKQRYADEWARFLYRTDVNAAGGQQNVITYTIDVFNAKPDDSQAALMRSMARVGGGKYFEAKSKDAIINALKEILIEIQATNSVFASAALPISANSRAENDNMVFLGLFRPDPQGRPRWFGNLKRFSLASFGNYIDLADANGSRAVNAQTGFFSECSVSHWTSDSGNYWESVPVNPSAASTCTLTDFAALSPYSDKPDGPRVEKGGVAEVLRKGNNPPATDATPTWNLNRTLYTVKSGALATFNAANSALDAGIVDYIAGKDTLDENVDTITGSQTRPSIHGDVVHSRLLPITYPGTTGTVIFYGANDGTLRAVDAASGRERWALIAPEFYSKLARLRDNSPLISFPSTPTTIVPTPKPKDYYFDGPIGAYQTADGAKTWIYPAMRRGGRTIYALDVSDPGNPSLKWRAGCPNPDNDTGCTSGLAGIGQTWSTPVVAFIKGYHNGTKPVIVIGGGYDTCEDADTATPSCSASKGRAVYVLDADTGAVLKTFAASGMRPVAGDVALVDIDYDGFVDFGYAADTGGNIWRLGFVDADDNSPEDAGDWTVERAAYTNGGGRKFLFGPAVLPTKGKVYLALGSGDRERPLMTNYPYTDVDNRFYVYLDDPTRDTAHDLDGTTDVIDATVDAGCTNDGVVPGGAKKSWFIELDEHGQGEQTVTSALIAGGLVVFSTNRPVAATNTCSPSLGEARGYWVNLLNGSGAIGVAGSCGGQRSDVFIGGGLPPSPVRGVVRIGGRAQNVIISAVQRDGAASSSVAAQKLVLPIKSRRNRTYWLQEGER